MAEPAGKAALRLSLAIGRDVPEVGTVLIGQVTRFVRDPAGRPDYDPPGNGIASARHGIR
jgi:hypothetical protein